MVKEFEKNWYADMKRQVYDYLDTYDNDIDTVAQVIENSPYVSNYSVASELLEEMLKDMSYNDIIKNAELYEVEDLKDDVSLVNAMFLRVAEEIMNEMGVN